jgi:hypothetical protein
MKSGSIPNPYFSGIQDKKRLYNCFKRAFKDFKEKEGKVRFQIGMLDGRISRLIILIIRFVEREMERNRLDLELLVQIIREIN